MKNHRLVPSSSLSFANIRRSFSNFDYVDDHFQGSPAIRRLFSQSRSFSGKTLIIEDISACGIIASENQEIVSRYPAASNLTRRCDSARFGAYGYTIHLETAGLGEGDVPNAMAAYAAEATKRTGATTFEFKIGRFSIETDIDTIRAVRHALGDGVALGVDANQALDLDQARRILSAVQAVRLDWCEEPVASFADMVRLYQEFRVPLSSHCMDSEKLRFYPEIEGIVGDLHLQGGLRGIIHAAPGITAMGRRFWQLTDGGVVPPDRPGLGVELDRPALEKYSELFQQQGELTYFDRE